MLPYREPAAPRYRPPSLRRRVRAWRRGATGVRMAWALRGDLAPQWAAGLWAVSSVCLAFSFVYDGITPRIIRWAIVQGVFLVMCSVVFLRRVPAPRR